MSSKFRNSVKRGLLLSSAFRIVGRIAIPGVAVLRYHSVQEKPDHFANTIGTGIIRSKAVFKEQMELIAQRFMPVTLEDILLFIKGEKKLPRKAVAVTFDDGFADNYEIAAPILNHYRVQAAFFITVNSIETENPPWFYRLRHAFFSTRKKEWLDLEKGKIWGLGNQEEKNTAFLSACEQCARLTSDSQELTVKRIEDMLEVDSLKKPDNVMMSWEQIKKLHEAGHIIGSHTLTHPNLAYVEEKDLYRELILSKEIIEGKLGKSIIHFSYPSPILQPHWTEVTNEAVKKAGYCTAVTCTPGLVRNGDDPLLLKRITVPFHVKELEWSLQCAFLGRIV